ncbi:PREDICTED: uncharacterized protein LOC104732159 [Camelina sativa]|uniref:Uncharacterized protein LOC104732159 n=1 Tax=Camelina sativa TaxID=90675 RepID=A0ABM0V2Y1_CAMSA|nr:PREDICTED: uncharacterized protein LOC104732159 [Camelina sativa]
MDTSVTHTNLPKVEDDDDEWDNDGFVIPSLEIEQENVNSNDSEAQTSKPSSTPKIKDEENNIYLGPHGAPPSQPHHDGSNNITSRKQRFKQKLKEADEKMSVSVSSGRENKLANLRELVGGGGLEKGTNHMAKGGGVSRDWLDPHCHESQFEKRRHL